MNEIKQGSQLQAEHVITRPSKLMHTL